MIPLEIPEMTHEQQLDLLDRQPFVDQVLSIASSLARNKKSKCYAINGGWGVGKSFVLDMFEEQAQKYGQEYTVLDQFVIFRYNCWEYDYYEEPLIAIVSCILEQYEKKVLLLDNKTKAAIKETLRYIGRQLLSIIQKGIKATTQKDINPLVDAVTKISENTDARIAEDRAYDTLFAFKTVLRELRKTFATLAEHQTVLIIVDELDRCLPEYTIKVLERLHHLFDDIPNVQVILSIDRTQLEHTVKQIYGPETNVTKYLAKFIDFNLTLTNGAINDKAREKFAQYRNHFQHTINDISEIDVDEFFEFIFAGIDIRTVLAIIEKCDLLHDIMNPSDEKADYSIMCIEILVMLLDHYSFDLNIANRSFSYPKMFDSYQSRQKMFCVPSGLQSLQTKFATGHRIYGAYYHHEDGQDYIHLVDLWGLLLASYRYFIGYTQDYPLNSIFPFAETTLYIMKFKDLLDTIS